MQHDSGERASETSLIPCFILEESQQGGSTTRPLLLELISQLTRVLQLQLHLTTAGEARGGGGTHPLLSPLLLQNIARFFTEYFLRYVDPQLANYPAAGTTASASLCLLHSGAEFNVVIDLLASAVQVLIVALPMENELIISLADLIKAMSKSSNFHRVEYLISLPPIGQIFQTLTDQGREGPCRLSCRGMTAIFEALGCLAVRAKHGATFLQMCTSVHTRIAILSQSVQLKEGGLSSQEIKLNLEQTVACLRGLALCPAGQDKILRSLFDNCLPVVTFYLQVFAA